MASTMEQFDAVGVLEEPHLGGVHINPRGPFEDLDQRLVRGDLQDAAPPLLAAGVSDLGRAPADAGNQQ